MALAQQGKTIDEKLLDNYVNRDLPIPKIDSITDLEDRLIHLLRNAQKNTTLCFRYNDLCIIIRHVEYEITSMRLKNKVSRRYNDFLALHELLTSKYPYRIIPSLPPKKAINVDKEFIEERRRSLKRYLLILCRHPTIYDAEIIKFFLTFQGTSCGDNMKATYKNVLDEFSSESQSSLNLNDNIDKCGEDYDSIRMFRASQTHISFLHQQLNQIRRCLKSINEKNFKNANDFANLGNNLQALASDSTSIDRWATGPNDYWPTIQIGLGSLPIEINAISERVNEQCKRNDEVINDHLDMLIELLQGYNDLCKRLEETLENERKAIQKANNQQRRSSTITDTTPKNDISLEMLEKRNRHALQCVQIETQLVYANLEAFVYILSSLGNSQCKGSSDFFNIWKSFANEVSRLGQTYITKSPIDRRDTTVYRK
ncbi:unnamed protein product [Rotaria sordida]|uniref:PX domain-containing protein n=2 Tax=Rotaria sordida TaxID=392033 RepID=A0A815AK03_9BILA|nr:unnamed protein product [Rotaria sordida]CAF1538441.1 unnamed protein product [Rotaria sordida]